jgi:hypothetical protein
MTNHETLREYRNLTCLPLLIRPVIGRAAGECVSTAANAALWTTGLIQPPRVSHVLDLNYGWEPRKGLMIKRGNRVKLTAHAEAALNSGRGVKSIWTDRRGVILRVTANKANAVVLWDGRKSTECLPIRALETEPAELG